MPRRARYRTSLLEELEGQLAFAPLDALKRQMEAAEALTVELEDGATYPFEFVIWKLTGFRPSAAPPKPIEGATLRGDLVTFILHCSERIPVPADARPGGAVTLAELAVELGVVEKTLRRWRKRGLLCHRVRLADGRSRVGVFRTSLADFARRHPTLVTEAADFSRMDSETSRRAITLVRTLVADGLTANLAAKRVASAIGRSHETVRQLLDRTSAPLGATSKRRTRSTDRAVQDRRFAYRAWRFGVPIEKISERTNTKPDAIRRHVDIARAERLRGLRVRWVEFGTFERNDAEATLLAAPAARRDLAPHFEPPEAVTMLETIGAGRPPSGAASATEDAMLAAYNLLKRRAKLGIDALARSPDRTALDRIETDLRWALRLKRRLAERFLPAAVARVQQSLGGPLLRRPAEEIRRLLDACLSVIQETIETVDPSRRQSPQRIVALETDRLLAQISGTLKRDRAAARHDRGSIKLERFFDRILPWREIVEPSRKRADLTPEEARLVARRYGHDGTPPRTLEELAKEERTTVARVVKRLADAERRGPR
ncbi:MAG: hypothetical protein SGJ09_16765 [Phycisphaerae bacterium]|nr:hypothetical protein [Phycisphaerae bacterium]